MAPIKFIRRNATCSRVHFERFVFSRLAWDRTGARSVRRKARCASWGKLIILLSNADLIEMLKLSPQERAAEDFLDKRIWDFIVSLPR